MNLSKLLDVWRAYFAPRTPLFPCDHGNEAAACGVRCSRCAHECKVHGGGFCCSAWETSTKTPTGVFVERHMCRCLMFVDKEKKTP